MPDEILLNKSPFFHENAVRQVLGNKDTIKVLRALCENPALPLENLVLILADESERLLTISRLSEAHVANYFGKALRLTGYGLSFILEYRERIYQ